MARQHWRKCTRPGIPAHWPQDARPIPGIGNLLEDSPAETRLEFDGDGPNLLGLEPDEAELPDVTNEIESIEEAGNG